MTASANSGAVSLTSGTANSGSSGDVTIKTGNAQTSGAIQIAAGTSLQVLVETLV